MHTSGYLGRWRAPVGALRLGSDRLRLPPSAGRQAVAGTGRPYRMLTATGLRACCATAARFAPTALCPVSWRRPAPAWVRRGATVAPHDTAGAPAWCTAQRHLRHGAVARACACGCAAV